MGQAPQSEQGQSIKTQPSLSCPWRGCLGQELGNVMARLEQSVGAGSVLVMSSSVCGSDSHVSPRGSGSGPSGAPQGALVRKEHH